MLMCGKVTQQYDGQQPNYFVLKKIMTVERRNIV